MLKEVGAEFLLNYLFPELRQDWAVVMRGSFYRNYSEDILELDTEHKYVELSRDSFLKLLPDVMLSPEDERGDNEQKHRRLQLLEEAFAPIDTFHFSQKLKAESRISNLLYNKLRIILRDYFDYDIDEETDPYCREVAPLLPYTSRLRGDIHFVRQLLSTVTGHKVMMRQTAWSDTDNSRYWMPKVYYDIVISGLTAEQYREEKKKIGPLSEMLTQRFLPFDMAVEVDIKDMEYRNNVLNYNTRLSEL